MALLSSCETIVEQSVSVEVVPAQEQLIFTADLGTATKTYLEYQGGVYKTRWEGTDRIFVLSTDSSDNTWWYDTADIIEGVGTSTAKFAVGSHVRGDKYYAFYGSAYYDDSGKFWPMLQEYQYGSQYYDADASIDVWDNNIDGAYFPMYAESNSTNFVFKNLCSILKVDIVGSAYIDNVVFTPNDPSIPVAGKAELTFEDNEPVLTFSEDSLISHKVCFYVRQTLNETEPLSCYISIPPQTYTGGFTLTINSDTGSMILNVTEDVTFERSQIRALSLVNYENQTNNTWGLIGSMTGWNEDVPMTPQENYQVLMNYYIDSADEFKFRTNCSWDVSIGSTDGEVIQPYAYTPVSYDGGNMRVSESGYYNIYLDVSAETVYFERAVECASYDEVALLPDNTVVLVQGFVFAPYARGFVMNVGSYWDNCILVYQGLDQSKYTPVMGNAIAMIARKTTYNNLPELKDIQLVQVIDPQEGDFGYKRYYDLYDPESFANINIGRYEYVKFAGTLEKSGNYYNVIVDGVADRIGSIEFPIQDLTEFIGKKVSVEGWFIGYASGGKYLKIVLRKIAFVDDDGSSEDVIPGDDIVVTSFEPIIR